MRLQKASLQFKSGYHRLVITHLIGEAVVIYPLYVIMFKERSGISALGVGTLLAFWQITQIIAEVPTGVIADRFSKKYSILFGRLLKALCFTIWLLFPSFGGYLAGFLIWGIGEAFISGAVQAYLYELNEGHKDQTFLKSYSRLKSLEMFVYTATYFTTFLIGPKYQLLLILSITAMLISVLLGLKLPTGSLVTKTTVRHIISGAKNNLKQSSILRRKFLEALIIGGALGMLVEMIVVNYHDFGASSRMASLIVSVSTLITATLFWLLHSYEKPFKKQVILIALLFVAIYAVTFQMSMWWQILGLFLMGRFLRILSVIQEASMLDDIAEQSRATVLSSFSLMVKLLMALQIFLVGFLAVNDNVTEPTFYIVSGSVLLFVIFRLLLKKPAHS